MARRKSQLPGAVASLAQSPQNPLGTPQSPTAATPGSGLGFGGGGGGTPGASRQMPLPGAPVGRTNFSLQGPSLPGVGIGPALTRLPKAK